MMRKKSDDDNGDNRLLDVYLGHSRSANDRLRAIMDSSTDRCICDTLSLFVPHTLKVCDGKKVAGCDGSVMDLPPSYTGTLALRPNIKGVHGLIYVPDVLYVPTIECTVISQVHLRSIGFLCEYQLDRIIISEQQTGRELCIILQELSPDGSPPKDLLWRIPERFFFRGNTNTSDAAINLREFQRPRGVLGRMQPRYKHPYYNYDELDNMTGTDPELTPTIPPHNCVSDTARQALRDRTAVLDDGYQVWDLRVGFHSHGIPKDPFQGRSSSVIPDDDGPTDNMISLELRQSNMSPTLSVEEGKSSPRQDMTSQDEIVHLAEDIEVKVDPNDVPLPDD